MNVLIIVFLYYDTCAYLIQKPDIIATWVLHNKFWLGLNRTLFQTEFGLKKIISFIPDF